MKQVHQNKRYYVGVFALSLVCLALVGFGCFSKNTGESSDENPVIDRQEILENAREAGLIMDEDEERAMAQAENLVAVSGNIFVDEQKLETAKGDEYRKSGALADVTGGGSYGIVKTKAEDGIFTLYVVVGALPVLQDDQHYEAWLVKRDAMMKVVSLGDTFIPKGKEDRWSFLYTSREDLSPYDFFVLTSEWNDGDTTPGLHILEGTIE